jgi:predicted Zn-dependent peptidase
MKFIINKNPSKLATIAVAFQAGSALEFQHNFPAGTAHFLEHFLFKGTPNRDSFELSREIAFYGGDSNAYTSHEEVVYFITLPVDHFEKGMEILHDMVTNPAFPEQEFEKEKQVILEELASGNDSVHRVIGKAFSEKFYSNYLSTPVIGTEESIKSIQLQDLKNFYSSFYKKENMLISVCSPMKQGEVESLLVKYFGEQDGEAAFILTPEKTKVRKTQTVIVPRQDLEQAHVVWAWPSFKYGSKEVYAAAVLGNILGDGMDSRLFQEVREKANLVYGIGAGNSADRTSGTFSIHFSTRPQNLDQAKDIILAEIEKVVSVAPTEEELQRSKNKMRTGIYRGWQSAEGIALKFIDHYFMMKKIPSLAATNRKLSKVTAEDVMKVAKKIFSGKNVMAVGKKVEA